MGRRSAYFLLTALLALLFSCSDYDSFTTDPSAKLVFSEDTVKFDTIVSTTSSKTKTLYVFNNNSDGLRLTDVYLQGGAGSHFRVNVDGQYLAGGKGSDFEIRKNDSILVRIEVTLPENGTTEPMSYTDNLIFRLESGVTQKVVLTAGSFDAYLVHGMEVTSDLTLNTDKPYVIYDSLVVREGATLTLAPGTRLMFHDKCGLDVYGNVHCEGTLEQPVVLRGDRMDHMFDYLLYDNTPNRWEGVVIHAGSFDNRFSYTDLHSGCKGIICEPTTSDKMCLEIENSVIHNIGGNGLQLNGCEAYVGNTQISNTRGDCVNVIGGAVQFIHCTVAQFYPFTAERGAALYISNLDEKEEYREIEYARFINCVFTGYGDDVIMGNISEGSELCPYLFQNCFMNTPPTQDEERFVGVLYDTKQGQLHAEKNFVGFDAENFIYDFTPVGESEIRGLADPLMLQVYPFDRLGRPRDGNPDAGCYEFVEQQ